jgi:transposase
MLSSTKKSELEGKDMKRLSVEDRNIMQIAIQQEIARSEESRYDHRLHGVLLIAKGLDCYTVADLFGQHPTTIQRWINAFNEKGFAGLYEGERQGRPRSLNARQWNRLGRDLRKSPRTFGYGQNLWDGKLMSHHLQQHYDVRLGVRQCQRIFHAMGFRLRKPRPVIAKADPAAQVAFKKTMFVGKERKNGSLELG